MERVLRPNRAVRPQLNRRERTRTDQFKQKSIWIGKANYLFAESRSRFLRGDMLVLEALQPVANRVRRDRERRSIDLAGAALSAPHARPGKDSQDCSRCAAHIDTI